MAGVEVFPKDTIAHLSAGSLGVGGASKSFSAKCGTTARGVQLASCDLLWFRFFVSNFGTARNPRLSQTCHAFPMSDPVRGGGAASISQAEMAALASGRLGCDRILH